MQVNDELIVGVNLFALYASYTCVDWQIAVEVVFGCLQADRAAFRRASGRRYSKSRTGHHRPLPLLAGRDALAHHVGNNKLAFIDPVVCGQGCHRGICRSRACGMYQRDRVAFLYTRAKRQNVG